MQPSSSFSSSHLFLLPFILLLNFPPAFGQLLHYKCGGLSNFTANSTYETSLHTLLNNLTSNTPTSGFSNATVDQVYGLAMCRGDVDFSTCLSCLQDGNRDAPVLCPYDKANTIWYDNCMLRYSNLNFLFSLDYWQQYALLNTANVTDVARFNQLMNLLMNSIADYASYNSTKMFATGEIGNYTDEIPSIYGLVQCTPDMTANQCQKCLQSLLILIPSSEMNGKQGGRMLGFRCNFRYEVYKFYDGAASISLTASPSTSTPVDVPSPSGSSGKKTSTSLVLAIAIPLGVAALLLITAICFWKVKSTIKVSKKLSESDMDSISSGESLLFDPAIIRAATNNFSDENKIGEGGFGEVYKGLLPDGRQIAVKKLMASSIQGLGQLNNELELVAKLQHRNLVRVLGVCLREEKSIIYEYVQNKSLDRFLFDSAKRQKLKWETRHKIICGVVRGLLYLHEESQLKVIHRDLKASNVLLDAEMNPKISDFGLAKFFGGDQTHGNTSRIVGTYGYMAPEYAMHGHFSNKSDIFSFGVLTLEIITGRKNCYILESGPSEDLLSYTWGKWSSGSIFDILDPVIAEHGSRSEILRCIHIALLCVQESPHNRPDMSTINVMLSSNTVSLISPSKPPTVRRPATVSVNSCRKSKGSKVIPGSSNDVTITELVAR